MTLTSRPGPRIDSSESEVSSRAFIRKPGPMSRLTHSLAQSSPTLTLDYDVPGELLVAQLEGGRGRVP